MRAVHPRLASAVACALLASCFGTTPKLTDSARVESSEDVANVFLAAYPAIPWSSIAEKLEPKNSLSTADARALAAITTQSQVSQFLSTFAAGLAIGLPSRTTTTANTVAADGSTSSTTTKKLDPGVIPASSGASPITLTDASVSPDLSKNPFANGVDASTQLMGGTAVYQLAQILDNQISKSLPLKGYQAYLLTFQVNLQPMRRDLPYDAYINLTLMPGSWGTAITASQNVAKNGSELSPIIVYPLIVADAMESSNVGRSVETIKQAALALSGIVGNIGINAGVDKSVDQLDSILGSDRNTLVTVGRVSDHTLRVRLGAQQQGSRKLALVPRTQNISVVVFTRAGSQPGQHIDKLAVISETSFVDAEKGGKPLPSGRSRGYVTQKVQEKVADYGFELNPNCSSDENRAGDLLRALDRSDFKYVSDCLQASDDESLTTPSAKAEPATAQAPLTAGTEPPAGSASGAASAKPSKTLFTWSGVQADQASSALVPAKESAGLAPFAEARLRRVVAGLMTLQTNSRFAKLLVPLRTFQELEVTRPPDSQLVFLSDEKSASKVILRGGSNIEATRVKARLSLTLNGKDLTLLPTSVDVDASGSTVSLSFPPIAGSRLMRLVKAKGLPDKEEPPESIRLVWTYVGEGTQPTSGQDTSFEVRMLKQETDPPANPVTVSSGVLVADSTGTAKVTLVVGDWDTVKQGILGLRVSGADVQSIEPAVSIDAKRKAIPLTPASVVTLTLGNLTPAQTVQLRTIAGKDAVGSPVMLSVEPARQGGK